MYHLKVLIVKLFKTRRVTAPMDECRSMQRFIS